MHKTYRIGEVADLLSLKAYVLRFWETEFPQLAPLRTGKGQRLYTEEHVRLARRIQQLVHEQGMTLDGARRVLKQEGRKKTADTAPAGVASGAAAPNAASSASAAGAVAGAASAAAENNGAEHVALLRHVRRELLAMRALLRAERKRQA